MAATINCTYCENPGLLLSEPMFTQHEHPACHRRIEYGALLERERIIAILKKSITHDWKQDYCTTCEQTDYLIELIKGDDK